ncbi:MAG TPA: low molecular weight protein-tyrosine-phosphatase [Clostridia bacterium]|nr:low molecular weight protein-tyrosine-phosphatase [Clostridia bacterium]
MIKVTFVCLGNICRSPMAELIFKDILNKQGLSNKFDVTSCATSSYEIGEPIYHLAKQTLTKHNIKGSHIAKRISKQEIESDFILVMDSSNYRDVMKLNGVDKNKVFKLCDFTDSPRDVADPWYTRDFETAYNDIVDGCTAFLQYLKTNKKI